MKDFEYLCELLYTLPGVEMDVKWSGVRVFCVGGKMLAATRLKTAPDFAFKVDDDRFLELTDRPGIIPAPYMARMKWIQLTRVDAMPKEEAKALVRRAYELIFAKLTKKLQQEIRNV